jgi:hypothetical protein
VLDCVQNMLLNSRIEGNNQESLKLNNKKEIKFRLAVIMRW